MMKMNMRIASLVAVCATLMCAWGAERVWIVGLQVNHLAEPRHVGGHPSFGWRMETPRAGARQVAYRVKVARTARNAPQELAWDSGEVADGRSVGIAYAGNPLESACRYAWTVAVKDELGRWTESSPAHFSTGLLAENDWKGADWIAPSDGAKHGRAGVPSPAADGDGTPSLPGFATGSFESHQQVE